MLSRIASICQMLDSVMDLLTSELKLLQNVRAFPMRISRIAWKVSEKVRSVNVPTSKAFTIQQAWIIGILFMITVSCMMAISLKIAANLYPIQSPKESPLYVRAYSMEQIHFKVYRCHRR